MAKIKAFAGYRPPVDKVSRVASPPYDVINSEEAREMAKGNEISFLHINKPEIDLDPSVGLYEEAVYQTAKNNLAKFINDGTLVKDNKPCLYAYSQQMGDHVQLGLMAAAAVDDYDEDNIKKHEKTRKQKEDDRAHHVDVCNCNAGPVFLTYKAYNKIDNLLGNVTNAEPTYDFTADDGIKHTMWVIDDDKIIDELVNAFAEVNPTYVADGHHRAKSGSRVRELRRAANPNHTGDESYNYFMAVFFPDNQLKILDYNRVVKDLNSLGLDEFLEKIQESFEISDAENPSPERVHDFGMYLNGRWYRLTAKAGTFDDKDPVGCLDVSILQNNLLHPILGIEDPRTDERIDFVGGIRGMAELEKRVGGGEWVVAFAMHPTTMQQLMDIADSGQIMPPKSTWFEPKLRSGMVVHIFD